MHLFIDFIAKSRLARMVFVLTSIFVFNDKKQIVGFITLSINVWLIIKF